MTKPTKIILISLIALIMPAIGAKTQKEPPKELSVFDLPMAISQHARLQQSSMALIQQGQYREAERAIKKALELFPDNPLNRYNLACMQARRGREKEAMESLTKAVTDGFNDIAQLEQDKDLASVREDPKFQELLEQAKTAKPKQRQQSITPAPAVDGKVMISESNTAWDGRYLVFRSIFAAPKKESMPTKLGGEGAVGELLKEWYEEGTAAGNYGDIYDNHDNDHSRLGQNRCPQVIHTRYSDEAKKRHLHSGLQNRFFFNGVIFGNSSTAVTGKAWRSQTRMAYTTPRGPGILYAQYRSNHLYVYPEHRDYDPGHNGKLDGKSGGYGDVYAANTPYVITSQGSSGSDQKFLRAIAHTLAAFHPKTKQLLIRRGAIMPTIQMIFRRCNQPVQSDDDYLSGIAHPTVFDGDKLDVMKMVTLAHAIKPSETPPLVQLRVIEEDEAVVGKDYFDAEARERLFDTPAAVARVHRTLKKSRRMVVSAVESTDLNDRELTWYWRVLRGNADQITITPLNSDSSKVELKIPYHERQPIYPGAPIESNRVDIGVFVHNGKYYSAPGFVSVFFLDNELRVYNDAGLIESVQYTSRGNGGNYVDPFIDAPKTWRDEYHYDDKNQLTYWSRHRKEAVEWFTPDGYLVTRWDNQRRPKETVRVEYVFNNNGGNLPTLEQKATKETVELGNISDRPQPTESTTPVAVPTNR